MPASDSMVFIIDDDEDIRTSLARALGKRNFVVKTYPSTDAFLSDYVPEQRGCLILDHGMPGMTGLDFQEYLNRNGYGIPVIFITGHGGIPESVRAIKAGAVDFLEKPFRPEVLVEKIWTALASDVRARDRQRKTEAVRARFDGLTAREREIVDLIAADPSNTTSKEVARMLDISPRTVDHHRASIFEKMDVKSVAELLDLHTRAGFSQR